MLNKKFQIETGSAFSVMSEYIADDMFSGSGIFLMFEKKCYNNIQNRLSEFYLSWICTKKFPCNMV